MLKTSKGFEVMTRKNGHESSIPLPKALGINNHQKFIINVSNDGTLICKPVHHKNIFDNPNWNHANFVKFMHSANLPIDQGSPRGKEL